MATSTIKMDATVIHSHSTVSLSGWHNMFPYRLDTNYIYIYLNGYYAFPPTSSAFPLTVSGSLSMDSGKDINGVTNSGTITVTSATQHPAGVEIYGSKGSFTGDFGLAIFRGTLTFTRS